ncbi:RidA family protein [Amycolatopsis bartoniae]|nr:RidA family protein [Amycolatopsis bartoniae]
MGAHPRTRHGQAAGPADHDRNRPARTGPLPPPPARLTRCVPGSPRPRRQGNLLLLSGQVGVGENWRPVDGTFHDEARAAFRNVRGVLAEAGAQPHQILKITAYLADFGDFAAYNEVWAKEFPEPRPARTTIGARRPIRLWRPLHRTLPRQACGQAGSAVGNGVAEKTPSGSTAALIRCRRGRLSPWTWGIWSVASGPRRFA